MIMHLKCPNDTDGDGNCGNRRCPHCHGDGSGLAIGCRRCGQPTMMRGTKLCDSCWHVERAVQGSPELARQILAEMDADQYAAEGDDRQYIAIEFDPFGPHSQILKRGSLDDVTEATRACGHTDWELYELVPVLLIGGAG